MNVCPICELGMRVGYPHTCNLTKGVKYDDGKPDFTFLPYEALCEVVKVLEYGARKYPEKDNWKEVPDGYNRYIQANLRHSLQAVFEEKDQESELYHLAHAVCCDLFALHFLIEKKKKVKAKHRVRPLYKDERGLWCITCGKLDEECVCPVC